jgi:hypothetical protein
MKTKPYPFTLAWLAGGFAVVSLLSLASPRACAAQDDDAARLKRVYELRLRLERERAARDNEARAFGINSGLIAASSDNPSVNLMRSTLQQTLLQQGDTFRCNDIDVKNGEGNVVVVCGSETGDVESTRTIVGGDLVEFGGAP